MKAQRRPAGRERARRGQEQANRAGASAPEKSESAGLGLGLGLRSRRSGKALLKAPPPPPPRPPPPLSPACDPRVISLPHSSPRRTPQSPRPAGRRPAGTGWPAPGSGAAATCVYPAAAGVLPPPRRPPRVRVALACDATGPPTAARVGPGGSGPPAVPRRLGRAGSERVITAATATLNTTSETNSNNNAAAH